MMNNKYIDEQFTNEYPELFSYIFRYVSFRIPHRTSVEDIVGDVILYAYAHRESFDATRGNMRQWLTGIAKNHIIDHWKKMRPTVELKEAVQICDETEYLALNDSLDSKKYVQEILSTLSPAARALFTLRYVDGLTHEEIARLVQKKPSTIRTFFSRTFATIRQNHSL